MPDSLDMLVELLDELITYVSEAEGTDPVLATRLRQRLDEFEEAARVEMSEEP